MLYPRLDTTQSATPPTCDSVSRSSAAAYFPARSRASGSAALSLDKEWDTVLLVLLEEHFDATAIFEADRPAVEAALLAPGSKARNDRSALAVTKFKAIGRSIWP